MFLKKLSLSKQFGNYDTAFKAIAAKRGIGNGVCDCIKSLLKLI